MEALSREQLLQLACTLARVGSVICEIGNVGGSAVGRPGGFFVEPTPYIWDIKED